MIQGQDAHAGRWIALMFGLMAVAAGVLAGVVSHMANSAFQALLILAGVLGIGATIVNLEVGLMALVFMTWLRLSDIAIKFYGAPSILKPFIALLAVAVAVEWLRTGVKTPKNWFRMTVAIVLYGVVLSLSFFYATDTAIVGEAVSDYIKNGIIAILLIFMIQEGPALRRVVWVLLGAGIIMGTIGAYQYLTGSFDNTFWGLGQASQQSIVGDVTSYRISGPIGDPNYFAQILVVLVPLALNRLSDEKSLLLKLLAAWALVACVLSIIFTYSRGGAIALAVVLVLFAIYRRTRPVEILTLVLLGLVVLRLLPGTYTSRLLASTDILMGISDVRSEESVRGRVSEMIASWQMFTDKPLLGVGVGNFPVHYKEYSLRLGMDPNTENRQPHDLYLEIAAETGLAGLFTFGFVLVLVIQGIWQAWGLLRKTEFQEYANLVVAVGISIAGYLAAAIFIHGAYPRYLWLLVGITFALPQVARNVFEQGRKDSNGC